MQDDTQKLTPIEELLTKLKDKFGYAKWSDQFGLGVELNGFSKSGTAVLYITPVECTYSGQLKYRLETRYDNTDYIKTYDDIVSVAWWWFLNYKSRETFSEPSEYWVKDFVRLGFMKETQVTKYEVV